MTTFTVPEREQIRKYLGYPPTRPFLLIIENRCAAIDALAGVADTVREYLRQLSSLDAQREIAVPLASQSFQNVSGGVTQHYKDQRIGNLRSEQRRYALLLADTMQLQIHADIFSNSNQMQQGRTYR